MEHPPGVAAGTLVTTPSGDKRIEEIVAGEKVLSGVGRGWTLFVEVSKITSHFYQGPLLRVTAKSGVELRVTPNHICFALEDGDEFKEDSVIITAFDGFSPEKRRSSHWVGINGSKRENYSSLDEAEEVAHNLAHANGGVEIEREAGFFDYSDYSLFPAIELRFMQASGLGAGMKLPQVATRVTLDGEVFLESRPSPIASIDQEEYSGFVYVLDIPETRNFAANGILVHDLELL